VASRSATPKQLIKTQQKWLGVFLDFISNIEISSKEVDGGSRVPLAEMLYGAQWRFLEEICEGLDRGVHHFVCLKARQLGISTIMLAIDVAWLTLHDKIQGALITDDSDNKEKFRILIAQMIESLPSGLKVGIVKNNRSNLVLKNGSVLDYIVAGRKSTNSSLGQSRGLNFVHATECSSWGSAEGVASLVASLAQKHPDRLYVFESTAKGFNLFKDMWDEASADDLTQKQFFIGWWSKEDYAFRRGSPEYRKWWTGDYDEGELELIEQVKELYGVEITTEQIAWHRWMRTVKITNEDLMNQNYPWTADQAFVMTGKSFFPLRRILEDKEFIKQSETPFKAYRYHMGDNFLATRIEQVFDAKDADLRVWEEPHPNGVYTMGIDPAFGRSDNKDRHAIQVMRCYADKVNQVAEYATDAPESYQITWVMAHLAGCYRNVWLNLEVNGPGRAIMQEMKNLKNLLDNGYLKQAAEEVGAREVFMAVRWYLYHRPDSPGPGYLYGWQTTADNKITIYNQLRDTYALRQISIRSVPMLTEMERIVQDGSDIGAQGRSKDDRTFAAALGVKAWIEWVRSPMIANGHTYAKVLEDELRAAEAPGASFIGHCVSEFFKVKEAAREAALDAAAWRGDHW